MAGARFFDVPEGIDKSKALRLTQWLIKVEAENTKTNKLNNAEMIHKIAKQIQGEVKCL